MKKLLLSGIAVLALATAGTAQAADVSLFGDTGLARTPIAASLAPMQFAIAADYVTSEELYVPIRGALGLPYGFEITGSYQYVDIEGDPTIWSLGAKWTLPPFVENLGLAVGGHYNAQSFDFGAFEVDNDGQDVYGVASYTVPMGEGMSLIPSVGVKWQSISGDNDEDDFRFFGSVLFRAAAWSVGAEYISASEDLDNTAIGEELDGFYWFGGRFYLNPMITLQAGYLNNTNWSDTWEDYEEGKFHVGAQFAFGGGQ